MAEAERLQCVQQHDVQVAGQSTVLETVVQDDQLGAELVFSKRFADHHRFTDQELAEFHNRCVRRDLDFAVTTEKDAVRLAGRRLDGLPVAAVPLTITVEPAAVFANWLRERLRAARQGTLNLEP